MFVDKNKEDIYSTKKRFLMRNPKNSYLLVNINITVKLQNIR